VAEDGWVNDAVGRYKTIIDCLKMGVLVIDKHLKIAAFNDTIKEWFPEVRIGMPCREILGCGSTCDGEECLVHMAFLDGSMHEKKFRILRDDEIKIFRMVVSPMRSPDGNIAAAVKVVEDVTEYATREATDMQTLQLAAVGQLAAGVAHEFNNINAVVKGHIELLLQDESLSEKARGQVKIMQEMVLHGVEITKNMLMFARDRKGKASAAYISDIVRDVLSIVSHDLRSEGIDVTVDHQPNVRVLANVSQIGQVIINLLVNARHAMMGSGRKKLDIRTWSEKSFAYISVSDTGCGIEDQNIKKLFSPFFTTKGEHASPGSQMAYVRGTGLGLSICHTIIEKHHNGKILVNSRVGVGTTFTVVLPLHEGPVEIHKKSSIMPVLVVSGHGERVLVVDDEPKILSVIEMVLKNQGYNVTTCRDSLMALRMNKEKPFDVVIADIKMPGISGWEMAEYLDRIVPRPVIVLMTGAVTDSEKTPESKADVLLVKPFSFEDLLGVLSRGLSSRTQK
jgi:signal transduction histidine kinase/CheY-like chemotaxis protein